MLINPHIWFLLAVAVRHREQTLRFFPLMQAQTHHFDALTMRFEAC